MKKFTIFLFIISLTYSAKAQRPNLPGDLLIDFGFSLLSEAPAEVDLGFLGSRAINIYYLYHIPFGESSNFSINPGIGLGMENYNFNNGNTLNYTPEGGVELIDVETLINSTDFSELRKSKLSANYLDIPVEFRFHANEDDHSRGLNFAVGGRVGMLIDSHTKIKYVEGGDTKKLKQKEQFGLSRFRFGVHGRLGLGSLSLFYYHNLSNLFDDNGPEGTETTNSFMAGLSFALF